MIMLGFETLGIASKRIDRFATYAGVATIMLAMVVSFVFLISSNGGFEPEDIVSRIEVDEAMTVQSGLREASDPEHRQEGASAIIKQSQHHDNVEATVNQVNIFDRVFSGEELCVAQAVYFEARGEPLIGQIAVAEVIRNRVAHRRFPSDACRVVFQNERRRHRCQFSFACDGKSDRPRDVAAWETALKIVALVTSGQLTTIASNATHYHATYVKPYWRTSFNELGRIGRHVFYSDGSA